MIFKQETIKSWFSGVSASVNNEVVQPFQNASSVIDKYNLAIQHNSLTQQGWERLLAQSDDSLKAYLTSIKGSTASMTAYNTSLQGSITGFTKVSSALKQYNALGAVSKKEQQAFATAVGITNGKLGSYLTGLNGAKASLSGYGISLITSTAKTIGLTAATTALNAALTMGISFIVTGLISAFTAWINKSEEITEKAQEAADKINSINDSLKTNTETVENAKKRYAELAQEVENLGKVTQGQGDLSNEEYKEFLDLSNQLAGVFPSLIKNYDENGNAILDLSGDVNAIVGSLDDLLQKEKELANQKIMEEFPDVFKGYAQDLSNAKSEVKNAQAEFDKINQAYNNLNKGQSIQMGFLPTGYNREGTMKIGEYEGWLKDLGLTYEEIQVEGGKVVTAVGDIDTAFTSKLETARENLQYAQQQLEGQKSSINSYLNTWLQGEFTYNKIEDSGLQQAVQEMLFDFDWDSLPDDIAKKFDEGDWNAVSEYLRRNILFAINDVQDNPKISKALSEIFTNEELTPSEKSNYLQQIQDYFGEDSAVVISLKPQFEDTETLQKQYNDAIEKTKEKFNGYDPIAFFKENSINTQEEVDKWLEIAQAANSAAEAEERYIQNSTSDTSWSSRFQSLWDSESFSDAKEDLAKLNKEAGITEDDLYSLARENAELASLLTESGMSAQFATTCFNKMCSGADGFSTITEDALALDKVLHGMDESLQKVKASKSEYDKVMEADDYNTDFKNYQEAYADAMQMFEDGDYGRHFQSAMEYFLGEGSYTMSIQEMYKAMKDLKSVFGENATNGLEFLDKLYAKKDALDSLGSSIEKLSDGTYKFDLKPEEFERIGEILGMTADEVTACTSALGMFGDYRSYDLGELEETLNGISIAAKDGEKSIVSLQGLENILSDLGYTGKEMHDILQDMQDMDSIQFIDFSPSDEESLQAILDKLKELDMVELDGKNLNVSGLIDTLKNSFGMATEDIETFLSNLNLKFNFQDAEGNLINLNQAKDMVLKAEDTSAIDNVDELGESADTTDQKINTLTEDIQALDNKSTSQIVSQFDILGTHVDFTKSKVAELSAKIDEVNSKPVSVPSSAPSQGTSGNSNKNSSDSGNTGRGKTKFTGTVGNAFANGYNGLPSDEKGAMRSEYGQKELTVYPNGTYEITDKPTIDNLPKGTVIFNEQQTERILKGSAHANGTVGDAYASGTVGKTNPATGKPYRKSDSTEKTTQKAETAAEKVQESFYALFDWMERKINYLSKIAEKAVNKVKDSITYALDSKYISGTFQKINDQMKQNAYMVKRYQKSADDTGVPKEYKKLIETGGTVDYSHIYDEELAKKIEAYEDWYKKSQACKEANEELRDTIKEVAEAMSQAPIEKFAAKIDKYTSSTELAQAKADNAITAKDKNKNINTEIKNVKSTQTAYKNAYSATKKNVSTYSKKVTKQTVAKNATKSQKKKYKDLMKKVKSAAESQKAIGDKTMEAIYNYCASIGSFAWYQNCEAYNAAIEANVSAKETYDLYKETAKQEQRELTKQKFDNVANEYENKIGLIDYSIRDIDNEISKIEARGQMAGAGYYESQKTTASQELAQYQAELAKLESMLSTLEPGTQEWYDAKDYIQELKDKINECEISIYDFNNAINELNVEIFEKAAEQISRIRTEQEFLNKLMSHEKQFDDNGSMTEYGLAALGTYTSSYYSSLEKANRDKAELDRLQNMLATGNLGTYNSVEDLQKRIDELYATWQSDISETYEAQESIYDMMSDKFDAELDALQKLVDARKEALNLEKDLYEYQNQIADKTKNITTLQKQIAAYKGDTSQEGQAKLQKLQVSLQDAQKDLKDTEYDRYISDQQDMLDKLLSEYQESIQKLLEDFKEVVQIGLNIANENTSGILATLTRVSAENGYKMQYNESGQATLQGYVSQITSAITGTIKTVDPPATNDASTSNTTANSTSHDGSQNAIASLPKETSEDGVEISQKSMTTLLNPQNTVEIKPKDAANKAKSYIQKHLSNAGKAKSEYSDVNQVFYSKYGKKVLSSDELKELAKTIGIKYDNAKKSGNLYKALKDLDIKGFAKGGIVRALQGKIRKNGDSLLASVNPDETVLTQDFTKLLPETVDTMKGFIKLEDLNLSIPQWDLSSLNMPDYSKLIVPNQTNRSVGDVQFNFEVNGCNNPTDFLNKIQNDQKVQRAIKSLVLDPIVGKPRLNVNRIK